MVCGSLERSWSTRSFAALFCASTALTALCVLLGGMLLHMPVGLSGLWIALASPTVAWCAINRREEISLYMVLKIPAPFLAVLTMVFVWFEVGPPLLGLFALIPCAVAYWYTTQGRYAFQGYPSSRDRPRQAVGRPALRLHDFEREEPVKRGASPTSWFRAWQEKRKLEKLWKRSFGDNDDRKHRP
jgi:hypothetical protein